MTTKLGKVVAYYKNLPPLKLHNSLSTWGHVINLKHYIFTTTIPMTTIPGMAVICNEEHPSKTSQGPLMAWSCKEAIAIKLGKVLSYYKELKRIKPGLNRL